MIKTGVHCSVRKGFVGALEEARALNCTTMQMFTQNPRGWKTRVYENAEFLEFRQKRHLNKIDPIVVHSPYLPNLCTSNPELYTKSVNSLIGDLERCEKLGAEFLVIHPGAYSSDDAPEMGIEKLVSALNKALSKVKGSSMILIENMAGGGRRLGSQFVEIDKMLKGVEDQNRIGVCFDTCHALAAGYDIRNKSSVEKTLDEFHKWVGLERIKVFHVNDSKGPLACHRDRHENLGKGHVGIPGFKALFNRKIFKNCAFILETPKEPMPRSDLENLKILRSCFEIIS